MAMAHKSNAQESKMQRFESAQNTGKLHSGHPLLMWKVTIRKKWTKSIRSNMETVRSSADCKKGEGKRCREKDWAVMKHTRLEMEGGSMSERWREGC